MLLVVHFGLACRSSKVARGYPCNLLYGLDLKHYKLLGFCTSDELLLGEEEIVFDRKENLVGAPKY